MKKTSLKTHIGQFESKAWSYYLAVPKKIGKQLISADSRRVLWSIKGQKAEHGALMPKGEIFTIFLQKKFLQKLDLKPGDEVELVLETDESLYGVEMPESFQTLLDQDNTGNKFFHDLSKNHQRLLIQLVGKVKNIDSQINKGLAILHHLKENLGKLDFKELNETIKAFNNRHKPG